MALLYTRVSSEEQRKDGLSLPTQLADCRAYVARQLGWQIGAEYPEVMSGKNDQRPRYQALLAEARRLRRDGQQVVVVAKWLHRFGRNTLERVRVWEELDALDVPIHAEAEGGVVTKLVHDILAAVAEEEVRQLGERCSAIHRHTVESGWVKIGKVPFGYRLRAATEAERAAGSTKRVLELDPVQAPYARELFERIKEGTPRRHVFRWAMDLPPEVRGSRSFGLHTVTDLLRNPTYISRPPGDEDDDVLARPVGRWPRLVSDEVWLAAQPRRLPSSAKLRPQASGQYPLTSLLRCAACGGHMRGASGANTALRYRCGGQGPTQMPDGYCTATVSRGIEPAVFAEVEHALEPLLQGVLRERLEAAWAALRARDGVGEQREQWLAEQRRQEKIVEQARVRVTNATRMLVDGAIDKAAYDGLVAAERAGALQGQRNLERLRREVPPEQPALPPLDELLGRLGDWRTVLRDERAPAEQRVLLSVVLETIVARRTGYATYDLTYTWTPLGEALRSVA